MYVYIYIYIYIYICIYIYIYIVVPKNSGTPKSSRLLGFSSTKYVETIHSLG